MEVECVCVLYACCLCLLCVLYVCVCVRVCTLYASPQQNDESSLLQEMYCP